MDRYFTWVKSNKGQLALTIRVYLMDCELDEVKMNEFRDAINRLNDLNHSGALDKIADTILKLRE